MQRSKAKLTQQGLTLIESLAAIVIFGVAVVAISPPIMLSMAARVRAHRAEQALKLAQGEIDRVRLVVERVNKSTQANDYISTLPPDAGAGKATDVGPPTSSTNCTATNFVSSSFQTACEMDINGTKFVVQSFRTKSYTPDNIPLAFQMGVRVYTKTSLDSGGLSKEPGSLAFSAATTSGKTALAVLYVPIVKSDLPNSAAAYGTILDP